VEIDVVKSLNTLETAKLKLCVLFRDATSSDNVIHEDRKKDKRVERKKRGKQRIKQTR
jgi:hypothetical protein